MVVTGSDSETVQLSQACRQFELAEILSATQNFDESLVIGHGGFGKVYKGTIYNNGFTPILTAIKRLDPQSNQGAMEFWAEVEMLSKLRHCHLVSLFGYCNYEKEMILVYEYMPNRTLEDHLYKLNTPLSWLERLNICIGAGRGLHYLHTGTGIEVGVIHRDVKSSNILLLENWAAKISDFGLSRIGPTNQPSTYVNTIVKGTFGYLDPNYFATGRLTRKSDVYAYGVVLWEVLCRKHAVDRDLEYGLVTWAQDSIKEGNLKHIIDSDIRGEIAPKCLTEFVRIAKRCVLSSPKHRPTMAEILFCLESAITLQMKFNSSLQAPRTTLFGRLFDRFTISSNGETSGWQRERLKGKQHSDDYKVPNGTSLGGSDSSGLPAGASPGLTGIIVDKLMEFSYEELSKATDDFSLANKIGQGGFGSVYYAELRGEKAAIKKMDMQASREFLAELKVLTHVHHVNLVRLIGYCVEGSCFLVYEYIENGNLSQHLHGSGRGDPLPWSTRVQIALDSARGLEYIHEHTVPVYIHRDIKSANILIDKNFHGKVADFGLTKVTEVGSTSLPTHLVGTFGYMPPEYSQYGDVSPKVDVYAFGVVLYELISAKEAIVKVNESMPRSKGLVALFDEVLSQPDPKDDLVKMIDPRLGDNYPLDSVRKMAQLAKACTHENPQIRPSMRSVMVALMTLSSSTEDWDVGSFYENQTLVSLMSGR